MQGVHIMSSDMEFSLEDTIPQCSTDIERV